MDKETCEDKYSEPETEEHLNGKRDLYEWIKNQPGVTNVVLEGWIPETKQRPDIMFIYNGKQCVIEYQCSPISTEYYERHELYKAAGINDIWICGVEKYIQYYHKGNGIKRLNELEGICCLYYNSNTKQIYKVDTSIDKKTFNQICDNKKYKLMKTVNDYIGCKLTRFIKVKDTSLSYYKTYKYPSPTGRRSNKYPYPVAVLHYNHNLSLAQCFDLNTLVMTGIK